MGITGSEGTDNFLRIEDPSNLHCSVLSFRLGLAELRVGVFPHDGEWDSKLFEVLFESPFYFEGPFGWQGANFSIASSKEKLELCKQIKLFGDYLPGSGIDYVRDFSLYEVIAVDSAFRIRILARDAYILAQGK